MKSTGAVKPLRVLLIEDCADDAELVTIALRRAGYELDTLRVQSAEAVSAALAGAPWDVIIADYAVPGWSGMDALQQVRQVDADVPFILVSGVIGEEVAVLAMRSGAQDYVLKQNLRRLAPAVAREVREAGSRAERRREALANRFLSRAGTALATPLDSDQALSEVAAMAVPEVAEWVAIDLIAPDERSAGPRRLRRIAASVAGVGIASHPAKTDRAEDLPPGLGRVARTGTPLLGSLRDPLFAALAWGPDEQDLFRVLAIESFTAVPVSARGQCFGVASFGRRSPRRFASEDLPWLEEIGRRCGLAIDSARLHEATREALRVRDEFLSIASHELRTPLMPLLLQIEAIERRLYGSAGAAAVRDNIASTKRQVRRLAHLVHNLLDVSRIASGSLGLEPEEVDLVALVREAVDAFQVEAAHTGSTIELECREPVLRGRWDPTRLQEVVGNLLSNAVKFGQGKPIRVVVSGGGGQAKVAVRDRGIGIARRDLDRIFERFERVGSSRVSGGLGLGLYVSQQIIGGHGGTISVESEEGAGSTFEVALPLQPKRPDAAQASDAPAVH